jgi:serine/threonine protein kinase/tetratricopeptide (TPR) repeat protein
MEKSPASVSVCSICRRPLNGKGDCVPCLLRAGLDEPLDDATAPSGSLAFGDFEIARREDDSFWELGRGAMGVTYLALDKVLNRSVALKVIDAAPAVNGSQAMRERFLREARAAAALRHPNVAGIFHFAASTESNRCYYAMELVEGETLEARVRREGPLDAELALEIAIQVTRALMAATSHGLVHRDLKPGNIMLTCGDAAALEVKVIDFGLAKATVDAAGEMDLTHDGFVGTPTFASPEQFGSGPVDVRSDIYSLGVTLWHALTGLVPHRGCTIDEIRDCQTRAALPVAQLVARKVPAPVIKLLRSTLAVDPAQRPASARELMEALEFCRGKLARRSGIRSFRKLATFIVLLAIAAAVLFALRLNRQKITSTAAGNTGPPASALTPLPEKSIAVLPFENLSAEKNDAFFADGIQDDVLTSLATITELKVISHTSVMAYRDSRARNTRQIGQTLGVANVLEGSVRRVGDRVAVNVQLIDTRTDRHIWAKHYDRTLTDSLGLQGELANEIATALRATLRPEEKVRVGVRPTSSVPAYEAYLRGIAAEQHGPFRFVDLQDSVRAFGEAVQIDPGFALAWAKLSIIHSSIYWMGGNHTTQQLAEAKKALDKAGALDPDAGQFYLARGYYHYWAEKDYEAAASDFEEASKRLPNSADALFALGLIDRRHGRWADALTHMEQATRLDPGNSLIFGAWGVTLHLLRRFDEELALLDRRLALSPNNPDLIISKARIYQMTGDLEMAAKLVQPLPLQPLDSVFGKFQLDQWMYERRYQNVIAAIQTALRQPGSRSDEDRGFDLVALGQVQKLSGDNRTARASFLAARDILERERRQKAPDDDDFVINLVFVYVGLGDRETALREAERSVALAANDALSRPQLQVVLAQIHAQFGDADAALRDLPRLLQTPASDITPAQLRLDPIWDPIRKDPRFQKLCQEKSKP